MCVVFFIVFECDFLVLRNDGIVAYDECCGHSCRSLTHVSVFRPEANENRWIAHVTSRVVCVVNSNACDGMMRITVELSKVSSRDSNEKRHTQKQRLPTLNYARAAATIV